MPTQNPPSHDQLQESTRARSGASADSENITTEGKCSGSNVGGSGKGVHGVIGEGGEDKEEAATLRDAFRLRSASAGGVGGAAL
jgi:hypothetical protein